MKFSKTAILIFITLIILSCGKNEHNEEFETKERKEKTEAIVDTIHFDSVRATKQSVLRNKKFKKKPVYSSANLKLTADKKTVAPSKKVAKKPIVKTVKPPKATLTTSTAVKAKAKDDNNLSFFYLKKIMKDCKVGEIFTQKELIANYQIPKDAIALIKSVEKLSENEVNVKWHSTWLIEELSDAKFKDGNLKIHFKGDNLYTSGDAIAIEYDKKMYNDLIITGTIARIPTVKGYYWQIGKE